MALLSVRGLTKRFGGVLALQDCSFDVICGEIVAVIGPNGAGKSTLFNCITGHVIPEAGSVTLEGRPLLGLPSWQIAARGIARTFQNVNLFPQLTVLQNVQIAMTNFHRFRLWRGLFNGGRAVRVAAEARARTLLERVGIAHLAEVPAKSLSFGEQRLVELARALGLEPKLLLLDEPLSGLNEAESHRLLKVLEDLNRDGLSILIIEHDLASVMKLAHKVVVLEFGRCIAYGPPQEVQRSPAFREAYLGSGIRVPAVRSVRKRDQPLVRATGVHTYRGTVHALKGVDVTVYPRELVAVIGPNGAGKSTLLGTLAGLYPPRAGRILVGGRELTGLPPERVRRHGIALVPERRGMFPELTVEESLMLGAFVDVRGFETLGMPPKEVRERCEAMYELFPRLKERRRQLSGTLSGGEQQMLAVARGLMAKPTVLMLDEPSLGLAEKVVEQLFSVFRRLVDEGLTILLVEQNARAALQVADRVLVLDRGTVQYEGYPHEIDEETLLRYYTVRG